jgi:hypothetical protein
MQKVGCVQDSCVVKGGGTPAKSNASSKAGAACLRQAGKQRPYQFEGHCKSAGSPSRRQIQSQLRPPEGGRYKVKSIVKVKAVPSEAKANSIRGFRVCSGAFGS